MSNLRKKQIRESFRNDVFSRDKYACKTCGCMTEPLDAHHITDRNDMPNGGYVKENGISLCPKCHVLAEVYHSTGVAAENYSPQDLYKHIDSSHDIAVRKSTLLAK